MQSFYVGMIVILGIDLFIPPPSRYPDLWVILNVTLSFAGFFTIYLWTLGRLLHISSKLSTDLRNKKEA